MGRISARLIGHELGLSAHRVNLLLEKCGLIAKSNCVTQRGYSLWDLTEQGKKFGEASKKPYSFGHIWDPEVIEMLKAVKESSEQGGV